MPPDLVVVAGPPAAGKTTLAEPIARRLGFPLVAKDALKEVLADSLGVRGRVESRRLGIATFEIVYALLAELLANGVSVVAEGNFSRADRLAALPPARVLQVHVSAPPEIVRARLLARGERHPVHYDAEAANEIADRLAAGEWDALALGGDLLRVDTTTFPDVGAVADEVAARVRPRRALPSPCA